MNAWEGAPLPCPKVTIEKRNKCVWTALSTEGSSCRTFHKGGNQEGRLEHSQTHILPNFLGIKHRFLPVSPGYPLSFCAFLFLNQYLVFLEDFHTRIQCILVIVTPYSTKLLLVPHFTTSFPLPTSFLLFYSLSSMSATHMFMGGEPSTIAWTTDQDPYPRRKLILLLL